PAPTSYPLFPYTTLFRSGRPRYDILVPRRHRFIYSQLRKGAAMRLTRRTFEWVLPWAKVLMGVAMMATAQDASAQNGKLTGTERSEEHTSELQSLTNLVC